MRISLLSVYKHRITLLVMILTAALNSYGQIGARQQSNGDGHKELGVINVVTGLNPSYTYCQGDVVTFQVNVTSDSVLSYKWTNRNGDSVGMNSPVLTLNNIQIADTGKYSVLIKENGTTNFQNIGTYLFVNPKPIIIINNPIGNSPICEGDPIEIRADIANATTDWQKDGISLGYMGGDTFMKAVSVLADAGNYRIRLVASPGCRDTFTDVFTQQIRKTASIVTQPMSMLFRDNAQMPAILTVKVAGDGPFAYEWYKDGTPLASSSDTLYVSTNLTTAVDSGKYWVRVISGSPCNDTVFSDSAWLRPTLCPLLNSITVNGKEYFSPNDTLFIACFNGTLDFRTTSVGAGGFQWYRNNQMINSATFSRYQQTRIDSTFMGVYQIEVKPESTAPSSCGSAFSHKIRVNILPQQIFTIQPMPNANCSATTHTMTVDAKYTDSFQWYADNMLIPGATGKSYTAMGINQTIKVYKAHARNSYCNDLPSNSVNIRTINPNAQARVKFEKMPNLIEQCTDNEGWTYYVHPSNLYEVLFGIKKTAANANVKFTPSIGYSLGIADEVKPDAITRRGLLMGSRRYYNVKIDSTQVVSPYDVKFFFVDVEKNLFLTAANTAYNVRTFSSDFPLDQLTFVNTTQRPIDSAMFKSLTSPLSFNYTVMRNVNIGKMDSVSVATIPSLIATNGGGAFYFEYYNYKRTGSIASSDKSLEFSIFPVPSKGLMTIDNASKSRDKITMSVFNSLGQNVFQGTLSNPNGPSELDLRHLSNGHYTIRFESDNSSAVSKIIIAK